uniref:Amino acid adenylation domain-containing protein n=1 Tax=Candidatus Kentrum sp. FW TaxID=2126338 RepID=A0A450TTX2_9GAMM|nr:MAG: amino acid adenylation domain-containing protein [Candidatus Kentron sp. FW]
MSTSMNTDESVRSLLAALKESGCRIWVEDGKLKVRTSESGITEELKERLRANREEILAYLRGTGTTISTPEEVLPQVVTDPDGRFAPFPLTDIQQAYLLGRRSDFELGGVACHAYSEIDCPYDEQKLLAFNRAWQRLVERHDMLRAVMELNGRQRILEETPPYVIPVTDVTGQPEEVIQATLNEIREEMSHQMLDIYRWPLFEIRATRTGPRRVRLHIDIDVLLMDAGSSFALWKDLYHLFRDPETTLPPLTLSFRDYVLTLEKVRETVYYRQARDYWFNRLDELPPAPALPLAVAPRALSRSRFHYRNHMLSTDVWSRLKGRSAKAGLTNSGFLVAAFAEILAFWSRSPHFTLNLPMFDRLPLHPQVNDILGDFTSPLLLEIDNASMESFEQRTRRIQQQLWEDLSHNTISAVQVLRELAQRRGGAQTTMPVVFNSIMGGVDAQSAQEAWMSPSNWLGEIGYSSAETPQVWLENKVSEYNAELRISWECVDELFPPGLPDDMFSAYCHLLELLASDETAWQRVSFQEELLAEQLSQRAMVNDTAGLISPALLHDFFVTRALDRTDAPAIIAPGIDTERTLTYGELLDLAKRTAHWLQRHDVAPNTLVAVVMEKGWEQVVAVLGVLMAGGAYLPIDAHLPAARRNDLLTDGEARLALTQPKFSDLEWPEGIQRLVIADEELAREEPVVAETATGPEDLAYVIYTSGSTGWPKGVMIDHRGAVNTILDVNRRFSVTEEDRVLCLSALNFDLSVYDIFGVLAAGGVLVIPEEEGLREPAHWRDLMVEHGITLWDTVPALKQMLVDYLESRGEPAPPGMRLVMMSGDWIPLDLPGRIRALWPEVEIIGLGGATEASIWSNFHSIEDIEPDWKSIPYGKPLTNQFFRVLDSHLAPRPVWVPGDLYIGGIGLAKGYWNDPEKTAERFITHPVTGERLYRTGDLGRYLPDGNLEFLGRSDFQVKIRGHRIELGEIEAVLTSHPAIREAVVTAVGEERNLEALAAYVVPLDPGQFGDGIAEELKAHVGAGLPGYMVPATFTVLDALPLTSSGKVDRGALPASEASDSPGTEYIAPISPTEELLAGLWAVVLECETIGRFDNFFDLGGHSLLATQLVSRIRDSFQVELPLRAVFEQPELSALAEAISSSRQSMPGPSARDGNKQILPPIEPQPADAPREISFAQQRLWFLDWYEGGNSPTYNMPDAVRLEGPLDIHALQSSLHWMVERHESLRMTFPDREGAAYVEILPASGFEFPIHDLRHLSSAEGEFQQWIDEHAVRPFDLARGPLFRAEILQLKEEDGQAVHVLLINMHHIISDGWSLGVFTDEWRHAYIAFAGGHRPTLAPLPVQYSDYAHWQRQWLEGEILGGQLIWWKDTLAGIPDLLALPTDYPRPPVQDFRGNYYSQILPADITAALKDFSRAQGVTLFMTFLAAFDVLLARYSGQEDICVGSSIANRTHTHAENLIGFFVNTLVLRTHLNPDQNFRDLLQQVRQTCLDVYDHQDIPFEFLVEQINPTRSASYSPLVQVSLDMQNYALAEMELPGLTITPQEQAYPIAKFDLNLFVWEQNGQLHVTWEYATSLFTEQTIRRMGEHFQVLLRAIVEDPERPVSRLPLLTEAERRRILAWNDTQAPYPQDKCVHELFEAQVARTPDAVAILFEDEEVSYFELNARANRFAHRLRALGVGPEVLVGLFVERSVEMIVGLLAILKAGGAYVPLDPEYPRERLAFMSDDADLKVLLCHGATRERVPECAAHILDVDAESAAIAGERSDNPERLTKGNNLAYVIYTSGSTGIPKGVMIERGMVANHIPNIVNLYRLKAEDRVLQFSSVSFDASVDQIFGTLVAGATLVLRGREIWMPEECLSNIVNCGVTVAQLIPGYLHLLFEVIGKRREELDTCALRVVNSDAEALPPATVRLWREIALNGVQLLNTYGPTETTVTTTAFDVSIDWPQDASVSIGKPFPGRTAYILDPYLLPVPIGVGGELYIGGAGVARGYLDRPNLTAEKFIPNPFSDAPDARLYRTGDLCRWLPDGNIEYLGRVDTQVKIRGFRIELGEIESMLTQHERVQEAAVIASEEPEDKRLLAYFVPRPYDDLSDDTETIDAGSSVEQWQQVHDDLHDQPPGSEIDFRFNIAGWDSSYTGEPIPGEEMKEWLDGTVERILANAPRRVLEIGCGSGMLVFGITPHCEHYTATDFSPNALSYVERHRKTWEFGQRLTLLQRAADDFDGIEEGFYDGIILNSVIQYFPSIDYLLTVLTGAVTALAPGGFIFIGDVLNLQLLEELHASVQFHQADNSVSMAELKQRVRRAMRKEEELLIDPDFFIALKRHLPQITHVQIQLKTGHAHNEMTRFRYDVTLHIGGGAPVDKAIDGQFRRLDWQGEKFTLAKAREILAGDQPELIAFENIPNARLMMEKKILERLNYPEGSVGKLRASIGQPDDGIEPEEFRALIQDLPYTFHINYWGKYDYSVVFRHRDSDAIPYPEKAGAKKADDPSERAWSTYANNPLQDAGDGHELVPRLRDFLKEKLPDYMVPSLFVPVEFLPLTPSGKIDRRALPAPDALDSSGTEYVAPISPTEELLAGLWAGVLKREAIGRFDNFFDLGGHSLLAVRLISRVRAELSVEIPIRALFDHPTIKEMADYISASSLNIKPGEALQEDEEEFAI